MAHIFVLSVALCLYGVTNAHTDSMPTLPGILEARVEFNLGNQNTSEDYRIWYNQVKSQVAVSIVTGGKRSLGLYRFHTGEYYHVDIETGECLVKPLSSAPKLSLFGMYNGGTVALKQPNQLLQLPGSTAQRIGITTVRGISCEQWRQISPTSDLTVDVYFSVLSWTTPTVTTRLPMRAHVHGSVLGQSVIYDDVYEFYSISTDKQGPEIYQIPSGVYCPGAKNTKPLPVPAKSYHFSMGIVDVNDKRLSTTEEWFDSELGAVKYNIANGSVVVHDFNTGLAYTMDTMRGNCSIGSLPRTGFDIVDVDDSHVRMSTAIEALRLSRDGSYLYVGQRTVRGITCDVWVSQANDFPTKESSFNTTIEWYFATPDFVTNKPNKTQFGIPVSTTVNMIGMNFSAVYNIYEYDETPVLPWTFDISQCFNYGSRKDMSFLVPGSYRHLVYGKITAFKFGMLRAIRIAGSAPNTPLSYLRITNIDVDYVDDNNIVVEFTLLDKAPQQGDVLHPVKEAGLDIVIYLINNALTNGKLVILLSQPIWDNDYKIIAKPNTLAGTSYDVLIPWEQNDSSTA